MYFFILLVLLCIYLCDYFYIHVPFNCKAPRSLRALGAIVNACLLLLLFLFGCLVVVLFLFGEFLRWVSSQFCQNKRILSTLLQNFVFSSACKKYIKTRKQNTVFSVINALGVWLFQNRGRLLKLPIWY